MIWRSLHTNHAKDGGEDVVDEDVAEGGDGRGTSDHKSRRGGARAGRIRNKRWRGAVEVAAALELLGMLVGTKRQPL